MKQTFLSKENINLGRRASTLSPLSSTVGKDQHVGNTSRTLNLKSFLALCFVLNKLN